MIMTAKKYVEDNYNAEVIYGDTDSIFCKFPLTDNNSNPVYGKQALNYAIKVGKDVEKNIAKIMPYPQKLNYEKSLYPFIILSKKRYVGNLYLFLRQYKFFSIFYFFGAPYFKNIIAKMCICSKNGFPITINLRVCLIYTAVSFNI